MFAATETAFCCPLCKGAVDYSADQFECKGCARIYPVVAGIVDFRICADPYIDIEADRSKALRIAERAESLSFAELVAFYYSITPEVPDDLARHYLSHHIAGTKRAEAIFERIDSYGLAHNAAASVKLLDVGCGTGGFLSAARMRQATCFGADIALRWLVVAKSRFKELGCSDITLVCACADHLPFLDHYFDLIVAENLIEHVSDAAAVLSELKRVRKENGSFAARTINRFALAPEPHVGVWGVGFLPRPLMNPYVKAVKGIPYEHIHLQSYSDLSAIFKKIDDQQLRARIPYITAADYAHHPQWKQQLFKSYNHAIESSVAAGKLLAQIGPYIDITT